MVSSDPQWSFSTLGELYHRSDDECPSFTSHQLHKYPTMRHSVTEICTHVDISVTKWCIVGYGTGAGIRTYIHLCPWELLIPLHRKQNTRNTMTCREIFLPSRHVVTKNIYSRPAICLYSGGNNVMFKLFLLNVC